MPGPEAAPAPPETTTVVVPVTEASDKPIDSRARELAENANKFEGQREDSRARMTAAEAKLATFDDLLEARYLAVDKQVDFEKDKASWQERVDEDRRQFAKQTIEMWRNGGIEALSPQDLELIIQDVTKNVERSALAELVLSRHGFKNVEEAFRTLKLDSVQIDQQIFSLPEENRWQAFIKSPAMKEQLKSLAISGGSSLALAGAVTLLGGPVAWAMVGGGVLGGAVGRMLGEANRSRLLHKQVDSTAKPEQPMGSKDLLEVAPAPVAAPEKISFNEKVGRDLFELIVGMQASAAAIEGEPDQIRRTEMILDLVKSANQVESRSHKDYVAMEKKAGLAKTGLAVLGAVAGGGVGHAIEGSIREAKIAAIKAGTDNSIRQAAEHGVRIFHDASGAHITLDPAQGHLVKQTTDGAWRFAIEHKDMVDASNMAHAEGHRIADIFHYYHDLGHGSGIIDGVPNNLPTTELLHNSNVADVVSAFVQKASADSLAASWYGAAAGILPTITTDVAGSWKANNRSKESREQIAANDNRLIGSINEVNEMLREKNLLGGSEGTIETRIGDIPDEPARREKFFADLADTYGVPLPENPKSFTYDWNKMPKVIDDKYMVGNDSVQHWYQYENTPTGPKVIIDPKTGGVVEVGVLGVDYEHNRIALVKPERAENDALINKVMVIPLASFIRQYGPHAGVVRGRRF